MFATTMDAELAGEVQESLRVARVILVERIFLDALHLATTGKPEHIAAAVKEINDQVKTFARAHITPKNLQVVIWSAAQRLTKGQAI